MNCTPRKIAEIAKAYYELRGSDHDPTDASEARLLIQSLTIYRLNVPKSVQRYLSIDIKTLEERCNKFSGGGF